MQTDAQNVIRIEKMVRRRFLDTDNGKIVTEKIR